MRGLEGSRSFSTLNGSFAKKTVKGADYWYFKTSDGPAGQREYYVGPDDPTTAQIMERHAAGRLDADLANTEISRLSAMLRQGGAMMTDTPSAKVVAGVANAGVFRLGAVLVGTHAFIALGNVLGVRWESATRTQDIDLAAARRLHVAVPQLDADLPRSQVSLNMGFLPVPGLARNEAATSFHVRGHELRVDLLTPALGPRSDEPVFIPRLNASAQPLRMLDFVMEECIAVPLLNGGATLVNVPQPARFALHKLMVAGNRQAFQQAKANKDRMQAAEMIEVLHVDREGDLELAVEALNTKPKS